MDSHIHSRQFSENITIENNKVTNYEEHDIVNKDGIVREHGIINGREYYRIFRNRQPTTQKKQPLYQHHMLRMPSSPRYKNPRRVLRKHKGSRNTQKRKNKGSSKK